MNPSPRPFFIPFSRVDATWASSSMGEYEEGCFLDRSLRRPPPRSGRLWSTLELTPLLFYPLRRCSRDCGIPLRVVQSSRAKEWRPRDCFSVSTATRQKGIVLSLSLKSHSLFLFLVYAYQSLVKHSLDQFANADTWIDLYVFMYIYDTLGIK